MTAWFPQNGDVSFDALRERMVRRQIRSRGILDRRVLQVMGEAPREKFVPAELRAEAYDDCALPIGFGQTISQPFTVAYMAAAAQLTGVEKVLEVGAGSGYGAAVLAGLAAEVHTIERIPGLAEQAIQRLERLGYNNVTVHQADGTLGLPGESPFDAIVVTASSERLPLPYVDQLNEGGRIVIPLGSRDTQSLFRFTRRGEDVATENLGAFVFVPLIGEHGWQEN